MQEWLAGCSKWPSSAAEASKEARRTLRYVEPLSDARTKLADFFSILLGLAGGGQCLVDFTDEAPFNFCDFLRAHAEDASTLRQFFEVGFDVEPGDIRGERLKRQHVLIS